ncbi:MAG: hypothetical protein FJY80_12710 [Candidatus Aminicenantes bacterium]|nr:hypothetical protein [Candidatus Aminicenantes bacterium]
MMRRAVEVGSATIGAFLAMTLLSKVHFLAGEILNPFVVAVLLIGLTRGEVAGSVAGAVCGLVADSFSLGLFGIAGLALTPMGFGAGFISRKVNVWATGRLVVFFFLLAAGEVVLWAGLTALVFGRAVPWSGGIILAQPAANALAALGGHRLLEKVRARHER